MGEIMETSVVNKNKYQRSSTLDAIRGVAILQVLAWHLFGEQMLNQFPSIGQIFSITWTGVDLFFVLSGFLIGGIIIDQRQSSNFYYVFYGRRALRILPLYVLLIVFYLFLNNNWDDAWTYLTFTQNFRWSTNGAWGPVWVGPT